MPRNPGQSALLLITMLLISFLLVSCGGSDGTAAKDKGTGIIFRLSWPVAKSAGAVIPAEVTKVRIAVSGPGMSPLHRDFDVQAHSGTVDNVPVGAGRTITFQGLNASLQAVYQVEVPDVALVAGQTFNCGSVTMAKVVVPAAVTGLTATPVTYSQIDLVWDGTAYEAGYKIERRSGAEAYTQIAVVSANVTTFSDVTVVSSTTYYYRVRATYDIGDSGYSGEATAKTPIITYSISGTVTSGGTALAGVTVTLSGGSSAVTTTDGTGSFMFSRIENGSYTLTPARTGYDFVPPSLPVTVAEASLSGRNFQATANSLPSAPSGLTARFASSSTIKLDWTDNAANEAGYTVERARTLNGAAEMSTNVPANTVTYTDTKLFDNTTYYYRVRAFNDKGVSADAAASETTPVAPVLIAPVLVKVTGGPTGDFSIGKYEVTQEEWYAVMRTYPSYFAACGLKCPVEQVSWDDIQVFLATLNEIDRKNGGTHHYRLPTEAEWVYAAQSGGKSELYSGSNVVGDVAWYSVNSGGTPHEVGTQKTGSTVSGSNGLGLFDMSGNVAEWLNDVSRAVSSGRVIRGGGWNNPEAIVRTTFSGYGDPSLRVNTVGFRLAE